MRIVADGDHNSTKATFGYAKQCRALHAGMLLLDRSNRSASLCGSAVGTKNGACSHVNPRAVALIPAEMLSIVIGIVIVVVASVHCTSG